MSDFQNAANAKFVKGAIEHGRAWNAQEVDAVSELQGEFIDTHWYSNLLDEKELEAVGFAGYKEKLLEEAKTNWLVMQKIQDYRAKNANITTENI